MVNMYCLTCKKKFNSLFNLNNIYITINEFLENQHSILFTNHIKHKGTKRNMIIQCPFCLSIRTINLNNNIDKTGIYRRQIKISYDKEELLKLGKKLKKLKLIVSYKIMKTTKQYILYEQITNKNRCE